MESSSLSSGAEDYRRSVMFQGFREKDSHVDVLYPPTWSKIVIGSLVKLLPFYRRANSIHETKMNEVHWVVPGPRLNLVLANRPIKLLIAELLAFVKSSTSRIQLTGTHFWGGG